MIYAEILCILYWTSRNSGFNSILYGITYAEGIFVAVGYDATILTSTNGESWTKRYEDVRNHPFLPHLLIGVTFGNDSFVAVGDLILQSDPI